MESTFLSEVEEIFNSTVSASLDVATITSPDDDDDDMIIFFSPQRRDARSELTPPDELPHRSNRNFSKTATTSARLLGPASGVFMRMTPNRCCTVFGSAPSVSKRIPHPKSHRGTTSGAEIATGCEVAV